MKRVLRLWFWPLLLTGCGPAAPADVFPFKLRGDSTRFAIHFDDRSSSASTRPARGLGETELCYLEADDCTIECFAFGSLLMFGDDDGLPRVEDNPLLDIRADEDMKKNTRVLQTLGLIGLIGSSVERMPETLAQYLDDPGDNAASATALAWHLLEQKGMTLQGFSRAGRFSVAVQLTASGRRLLEEGLQNQNDTGALPVLRRRRSVRTGTRVDRGSSDREQHRY